MITYGDTYWYWNKPYPAFTTYLCNCPTFGATGFDYRLGLRVCHKCDKLPHTALRDCTACRELFLKDFHAPSYNPIKPLCWNCIDTEAPMWDGVPSGLVSQWEGWGVRPPQIIRDVDTSEWDEFLEGV